MVVRPPVAAEGRSKENIKVVPEPSVNNFVNTNSSVGATISGVSSLTGNTAGLMSINAGTSFTGKRETVGVAEDIGRDKRI
jgi:hypothetical protein